MFVSRMKNHRIESKKKTFLIVTKGPQMLLLLSLYSSDDDNDDGNENKKILVFKGFCYRRVTFTHTLTQTFSVCVFIFFSNEKKNSNVFLK